MTKLKKRKKRRAYPPKYREERAKLAQKTQPWQHATGPKTEAGKASSSTNALKHGLRSAEIQELRKALKLQRLYIKSIRAQYSDMDW